MPLLPIPVADALTAPYVRASEALLTYAEAVGGITQGVLRV